MSEAQEKLDWLAFRYVANELGATEAREFELLLTTDQAAREAVANAVEETIQIRRALAGAVVVTAVSCRLNSNRKKTRIAFVAIGSCLTLILALCLARSWRPISGGVAHQAIERSLPVSPAQLAYAWAESRNGLTELQPSTSDVLTDSLDVVLIAAIDSESEPSLAAPGWMLAALAKMDGGIDSNIEIQE